MKQLFFEINFFPDGEISTSIDSHDKNVSLQKYEANLTSNLLLTNFFSAKLSRTSLYILYIAIK